MKILDQNEQAAPEMPRFDDGMVNIGELIRTMAESLVNEIMDAQAEEACAEGNRRNGYRERTLVTSVGEIRLRIPKLRMGTYFPEDLIARYSRTDRAVIAAVSEMVANGVSTRKVARVAGAMGIDRMSASQVSRICESLDGTVSDLCGRDLSGVSWPYIWLDATYIKCRDGGHVSSCALVTAIGAGSDGYRRLLGMGAVDTESYAGWLEFLRGLRERGVSGVACVTSDAHEGLRRAIEEAFPGAAWQRCIVHLERNAASRCTTRQKRAAVLSILHAVFSEDDPALVRELYQRASGDRVHLPGSGRAPGRGRARCPGLPRLPLRASPQAPHQQRAGAREPRAQAPFPRGAGLPLEEIADKDDGSRALRDGRGLGKQEVVHRRLHSEGRGRSGVQASGTFLCRQRRRTRPEDHRARLGRQPDRKEGSVRMS